MEITANEKNSQRVLVIEGKVDSGNAREFEEKLAALLQGDQPVLDLQKLEYISSAGLRVLLNLRKRYPELELINASSSVYEVLDITGFTQMMKVSRVPREISLEGAKVIGSGANGIVYRMNDDTVVKVYKNSNSPEEIRHEREVARDALVLGIPTAISYELVKVGDCYASVFEMLDAKNFSTLLAENPEKMDEYVKQYVDLLKLIHSTKVPEGMLPNEKEIFLGYLHFLESHLPEASYAKLLAMGEALADDDLMIHADYHTKNLMLQNGEVILIDMDTIATGAAILDFGFMYNAYQGYYLYDSSGCSDFLGIPYEMACEFWKRSLKCYFPAADAEELRQIESRAKVIGLTRLYRKKIRDNAAEKEQEFYRNELICGIDAIDHL